MESNRRALLSRIWSRVDPRLTESLQQEFERPAPELTLGRERVVLVGHRVAGKSWLLDLLAEWVGLPGVDLDEVIAKEFERPLREWVATDEGGFRAAERACFQALPTGVVVAAGGGFLSLHQDLLSPHTAVLVPVTFETYAERLRLDNSRPRLRPELPLEVELHQIYAERERLHRRAATIGLGSFLRATEQRAG